MSRGAQCRLKYCTARSCSLAFSMAWKVPQIAAFAGFGGSSCANKDDIGRISVYGFYGIWMALGRELRLPTEGDGCPFSHAFSHKRSQYFQVP